MSDTPRTDALCRGTYKADTTQGLLNLAIELARDLERENAALRADVEKLRVDAENYRWLIGDLYKPKEMEARQRLLQRMDMMGRGAIAAAIDAARADQPE